jgi:predicted nucleic acid-binding protein
VDLEVLSVIRRLLAAGQVTETRAAQAKSDLEGLPILRAPHRPLLGRCWQLRNNLSAYRDDLHQLLAERTGVEGAGG